MNANTHEMPYNGAEQQEWTLNVANGWTLCTHTGKGSLNVLRCSLSL